MLFIQHDPSATLLIGIDVDFSLLPFAGWNLALEHDVNLTVGSILHLRQLKESDDEAPEAVSTVKAATEIKNAATATHKAAQEYVPPT